ncbi:MAG: SiaB family protein kinase [Bacteroidales bacterium]|nr:SiaB family protein kinase [Bacteroidales bacterium]
MACECANNSIARTDFDLSKWVEQKREGKVLLEHVGSFTSDFIDAILPEMEQDVNENVENDGIRKKVFHVFVECIQNLYHHVEPLEMIEQEYGDCRMGAIFLVVEGNGCRITTGNFVKKTKVEVLSSKIEKINAMDSNELKAFYRETISKQAFSAKGGAGIGMIDIARKSGNKLGYQFYSVAGSPDLCFFSFDVFIS